MDSPGRVGRTVAQQGPLEPLPGRPDVAGLEMGPTEGHQDHGLERRLVGYAHHVGQRGVAQVGKHLEGTSGRTDGELGARSPLGQRGQ